MTVPTTVAPLTPFISRFVLHVMMRSSAAIFVVAVSVSFFPVASTAALAVWEAAAAESLSVHTGTEFGVKTATAAPSSIVIVSPAALVSPVVSVWVNAIEPGVTPVT
jgi:hypothetical protein